MIVQFHKDNYFLLQNMYNQYFNCLLNDNDPFKKIYCYTVEDNIVGFIDYSVIYDRIELNYILVLDNYRRLGIASKLIEKMLEEKSSNISLEVSVNNIGAINLYKKYEFEIVSKRINYYKDSDAYLMLRK